ncbi:MAG: mobile mystery protein B [Burkholderiales bacterium]|nr:mobile mystery protein B [Burkholderiales bacterium]
MALNLDYPDGATPLTAEELEGLIPAHITTRGELNAWEARNVLKAEQWLLARRRGDILTPAFVRRLHQRMFDETWRWAGIFRNTEKNIGADPAHIAPRLSDLCEDVKAQLVHKSQPLDEIAARFHHRLVSIHPFANGNGRHTRLMTDLLLISNGAARFTWGEDALIDEGEVRARYIAALRAADARDYAPLFEFVRSGSAGR